MLFELLRELVDPGVRSRRDIRESLDVDDGVLGLMLQDLLRKGYVQKNGVCGGGCLSCGYVCPFAGGNAVSSVTWEITDKGRGLLHR